MNTITPDSTNIELIHLINKDTTPQINILGLYLDVETRQTVEEIESVWGKLTCKIDSLIQKGEAVVLIGDMNRPIFNTNMSKGMKLLMEYLEEGTVRLINNNTPTRFDPSTKKGSVLDFLRCTHYSRDYINILGFLYLRPLIKGKHCSRGYIIQGNAVC